MFSRPNACVSEVDVDQPEIGEVCRLVTDKSENEIVFAEAEFVSVKSYPKGIEPGDRSRGFLRVRLAEGLPDGTRFVLTFKDVNGRLYECEYDTAQRTKRSDDVSALGSGPGVEIRQGRISVRHF